MHRSAEVRCMATCQAVSAVLPPAVLWCRSLQGKRKSSLTLNHPSTIGELDITNFFVLLTATWHRRDFSGLWKIGVSTAIGFNRVQHARAENNRLVSVKPNLPTAIVCVCVCARACACVRERERGGGIKTSPCTMTFEGPLCFPFWLTPY
jgi:hypothetical protein